MTTIYRTNLTSFNVHIGVVSSDIEVFNWYVMDNCQALKNSGNDINKDNFLECFSETYLLSQDKKLHAYIVQLKTSIDDGTLTQTAEQLLDKAFNFYKSCKNKGT